MTKAVCCGAGGFCKTKKRAKVCRLWGIRWANSEKAPYPQIIGVMRNEIWIENYS